jgi:hypothetical protein
MRESKGLSQILTLIIAASVLMIAAMLLVFMTTGSVGGVGETTSKAACKNAVNFQCSQTTGEIDTPASCTSDGSLKRGITSSSFDNVQDIGSEEVTCSSSS